LLLSMIYAMRRFSPPQTQQQKLER